MKKLTYEDALKQIKEILTQIENEQLSVDEISDKIKKAKKLFEFCYDKLKNIKEQTDSLLEKNFYDNDK